jgi:hypothetical protein
MDETKTPAEQEEQWKAEADARTLAMADAIGKDPERMKRAQDAAGKMVKDSKEQLEEQEAMTRALQRLSQHKARKAREAKEAASIRGRYPRSKMTGGTL